MPIIAFKKKTPNIHPDCYISPTSTIIGDVKIGSNSSIWFEIGNNTNIQDNSVIHVTTGKYAIDIGNNVTIGHSVTLHGCSIKDNSLVGIGSIILDQSEVEEWSIIAAGSVLKPATKVPSGKLWGGAPAKEIRNITEKEKEWIKELSMNYTKLSKEYLVS